MNGRWFITGTDTEVGKSVATACLAAAAATRMSVIAAKPVASGVEPGTKGEDAELLGFGAGHPPKVFATFEAPVSPHRAAAIEARTIQSGPMRDWIEGHAADCVLIEGVGGWRVPVGDDVEVTDLAAFTRGRVVVVAADRLGVINHARLTVEAAQSDGHDVIGIILNRGMGDAGKSGESNLHDLQTFIGLPVAVLAHVSLTDRAALARAGQALWRVLNPTGAKIASQEAPCR